MANDAASDGPLPILFKICDSYESGDLTENDFRRALVVMINELPGSDLLVISTALRNELPHHYGQ